MEKAEKLAKRLKGQDTTEEVVSDMLRGSKSYKEREKKPQVETNIFADSEEIIISLNVYHYLTALLKRSEKAREIQDEFDRFCRNNDRFNSLEAMEQFTGQRAENTYNRETILSGVLQYMTFPYMSSEEHCVGASENRYKHDMILLQTHRGGDVRGGYSTPRAFEMTTGWDRFVIKQTDVDARCTGNGCEATWYSDNCGYNWYDGPDFEFEETEDDEYGSDNVLCSECGNRVKFWVHL